MNGTRNDQERWQALLDAVSDEITDMPNDMALRELAQDDDVEHVKSVLEGLLGEAPMTPYEATKAALDEHQKTVTTPTLPETPEGRRSLLADIMMGNHAWSDAATLAFRDLSDPSQLSDDEVEGILEDLVELHADDEDG